MSRSRNLFFSLTCVGFVTFLTAKAVATEGAASVSISTAASAPLSGMVRANGKPIAGATLLVKCACEGARTVARFLRSQADGTFVWPDAPRGSYTIAIALPGFRPLLESFFHETARDAVSFANLNLEPSRGEGGVVRPRSIAADPWIARAITPGDVLRETPPAVRAANENDTKDLARETAALVRLPVNASIESVAGISSGSGASVSTTSIGLSGRVGGSGRWGMEGRYSRLSSSEGGYAADASRLAVELAPSRDQEIRVAGRRQKLQGDEPDPSRLSSYSVDWSGSIGVRSRGSVSARLISHSNLRDDGVAAAFFAPSANVFEVLARYRTELETGPSLRFVVGYRSDSSSDPLARPTAQTGNAGLREARAGWTAGFEPFAWLLFEGGATGDYSERYRGVTPEFTVTLRPSDGLRVFGTAARRFDYSLPDRLAGGVGASAVFGTTGPEDASGRLARSVLRAGIRYDDADGGSASIEGSQREIGDALRYVVDDEFTERLESLYFFPGDVVREIAGSITFKVAKGVDARLSARSGHVRAGTTALQRNDAAYTSGEAAIRIAPTGTLVGIGYRNLQQALGRGPGSSAGQSTDDERYRNNLEAIALSLAQTIPLEVLTALGSEWRALVSFEFGSREEQKQARLSHSRIAGGIGLSF